MSGYFRDTATLPPEEECPMQVSCELQEVPSHSTGGADMVSSDKCPVRIRGQDAEVQSVT